MQLAIFQLDAFTDRLFGGNPAAYVPLVTWLPDPVLQSIARENNLSETAFTVPLPQKEGSPAFHLRWFTPAAEVDLCGHATLAAAAHLFERAHPAAPKLAFETRSGWLSVTRGDHGRFVLDFPTQMPERISIPESIADVLGATPVAAWALIDHLYVFDHEAQVRDLKPDMNGVAKIEARGVIVTAPADDRGIDFVSRFFAPSVGVPEDPVTGSAHTELVPYWAARLNQNTLRARQISARGGDLWCELVGDRVRIAGHVHRYLEGTIEVT